MWNRNPLDADIDYAVRMVKAGYATVEQAARTCGVPVPILQARLAAIASSGAATGANKPAAPGVKTRS